MLFNELLNKPAPEADLLKQITEQIQAQYLTYQDSCYFIKLDRHNEQASQIVWIKFFSDMYALGNFYYDTVYQRACILVKFEEGSYELLIQGFQICDRFKIWPDKTEGSRPMNMSGQRETIKMVPRELIERGFGEITGALAATKRNKAV